MRTALTRGLLFGVGGVYLAAVGVLLMLHNRWIVIGTLSLGQAVLMLLGLGAGITALPRGSHGGAGARLAAGALAGLAAAIPLAALAALIAFMPLRSIFIALSSDLLALLTTGLPLRAGIGLLLGAGLLAGLVGAGLRLSAAPLRRALVAGAAAVVIAGVFQELIQLILQYGGAVGAVRDFVYTWEGLTGQGAIAVFIGAVILQILWSSTVGRLKPPTDDRQRQRQRMVRAGVALLALAILPALAGAYIGQVLMLVGLYILMGMGLNLEVGLAGLLDLGFVAFFAVGAYSMALLTADSPHALLHLSFWAALPISVVLAVMVGVVFGLPVLGVRGDYLAVATMGLGEIVRVLVASDFAAPLLGGAQGILQIPKPHLGGIGTRQPGAALLSHADRLRRRRLRRVAAGELAPRPCLDGAARR